MAKDPGIDYGMGQSNIDHEMGIRYGVIPIHDVLQAWCDQAELEYPEHEPEDGEPEEEICFDDSEPIGENYYAEGYEAIKDSEDPDIMILKSPYFTYAQFCSPCAPGAGYLRSYFDPVGWEKLTGEEYKELAEASSFPKVYCFGHDWFEEVWTERWIDCSYCNETGFREKESIPNYDEERFIANGGRVWDDKKVFCWACVEQFNKGLQGKVKEMVAKAPYRIFRVDTGEEVTP